MLDAVDLRAKRTAAGISGSLLCRKLGIPRSRLSNIERGYVDALPEELARIEAVLGQLINEKSLIQETAAALGWPAGSVR